MKYLMQLWNWFNNKKTNIGVALTTITHPAFLFLQKFYTEWGISWPWYMPKLEWTIIWIGGGFLAIGGAHKLYKYNASTALNDKDVANTASETNSTESKPANDPNAQPELTPETQGAN